VKGLKNSSDSTLVNDAAYMLFDQAQILEGRTPSNLPEFAQRLTRLMERGLSV
jgi:HSP90 family molecular chaperone